MRSLTGQQYDEVMHIAAITWRFKSNQQFTASLLNINTARHKKNVRALGLEG